MKASEERKLKREALVLAAVKARSKEILVAKQSDEPETVERDDKPKRKRKAE